MEMTLEGVLPDRSADFCEVLNLLGREVVENLAAYFAHGAGCDLLHLPLACGAVRQMLTMARASVNRTYPPFSVRHDAGETRR